MSVIARLAGFAGVLVLVFALGAGVGTLVDPGAPPDAPEPAHPSAAHSSDR